MTRYRHMGESTVPAAYHWSDALRDERHADKARALAKAHGLSAELQRTLEHNVFHTRPWDAAGDTLVYSYVYGRCVWHEGEWTVEALPGTPAREVPDFGHERPVPAHFRWIEKEVTP